MSRSSRIALVSCVCLSALTSLPVPVVAQDQLPSATIGMITEGPTTRFTRFPDSIRDESQLLLQRDAQVEFTPAIEAGASVTEAESALDRLLQDPSIDVVLALGPFVSHLAARRPDLPKPVVASFVYNAEFQGLPLSG